jgi:hypothetical protein
MQNLWQYCVAAQLCNRFQNSIPELSRGLTLAMLLPVWDELLFDSVELESMAIRYLYRLERSKFEQLCTNLSSYHIVLQEKQRRLQGTIETREIG